MMRITLSDSGKRFNREWIFRHFSYEFVPGKTYAITGPNGSGKSTLLQTLGASMEASEGTLTWQHNSKEIAIDKVYSHMAIAAPYVEVIEEMTLNEFLNFHHQFKPLIPGITVHEIITEVELDKAREKQIRYFSSGMKQRVKLAQAIFSAVPLLLLDEPCTNLDSAGIQLYHSLIERYGKQKTIIVSSNDVNEYSFCEHTISIMDYK